MQPVYGDVACRRIGFIDMVLLLRERRFCILNKNRYKHGHPAEFPQCEWPYFHSNLFVSSYCLHDESDKICYMCFLSDVS